MFKKFLGKSTIKGPIKVESLLPESKLETVLLKEPGRKLSNLV